MKYEIEQMLKQQQQESVKQEESFSIVNISSVAGVSANQGGAIYAASKAGVIGLTKVSKKKRIKIAKA